MVRTLTAFISINIYSILNSVEPQEPVKVVRGAIATILIDDLFSIGTEETKQCLSTAQVLMQQFSRPTETEKVFASWMTGNRSMQQARRLVVTRRSYGSNSISLFPQRNIVKNF